MSAARAPADLREAGLYRNPGEPGAAEADAGEYSKPRIKWQGLTIAIENPAGSVRRGRNRHGVTWEVRMRFDYGEILGTMGVDGDPVDIYMGPNLDAPTVYVVHQRRVNDWTEFDEDKVMVGFDSQADAEQAFLSNYNDPRFLGPVTAMPVAEFVAKVRATKKAPAMIKALFLKTHVDTYTKKDGTVVAAHEDKRGRTTLYHGSGEHVTEIKDRGLFGGLFASGRREAAASHGSVVHRIDLPDSQIMTQSQLENVSDDELKAVAHWVDDDDMDRLRELVVDDEQADDDDARIMRADDAGEASWEAQRLRGELAKRAGFKAVEMNDEHGTSYLVLPGVTIQRDDSMTKSTTPVVLFFKAHVGAYLRGGRMVNLAGYQGRSARAVATPGQLSLFGSNKPLGPSPFKGADTVASTPDLFDADEHGEMPPGCSARRDPQPEEPTGEHDHLLQGLPDGAKWRRGKGLIRDHYGVEVDGEVLGNYHAKPEDAVAAARQSLSTRASNEKASADHAAAVGKLRDRLLAGGDVTDMDLKLLGLKDGSSGLEWFIPAAAKVFDISSRAVRPHIADMIRIGHTDMGAKKEFVAPKKALRAIAAGLTQKPPDTDKKILFVKPNQSEQSNAASSNLINNSPEATAKEKAVKPLTDEQRTKITRGNAAWEAWKAAQPDGATRAAFKEAARAGTLDHLYDVQIEADAKADAEDKAAKKAKSDAWRERNVPKLAAAKKDREEAWRTETRAKWSDPNGARTYLDVPFDDKDRAKAAGARWDTDKRRWYHTHSETPESLKRFLPKSKPVAEADPKAPAQPTRLETQKRTTLPTSGRVSEDDPSIYGSWLLGHEYEPWSSVRQYAPAHLR